MRISPDPTKNTRMFKIKEKAIYLLNGMGIGSNLIAWVSDNPAFVTNLLLFAIPTAVFTILKGRQKLMQQQQIHELDMMRIKQELKQDHDIHLKNLRADSQQNKES